MTSLRPPEPADGVSTCGILVAMDVAPDVVRAELERLLASETFVNSGRLSRLLRFLVERTLDGRQDEIKEYVVGTEVFDRGPNYDPRLDSIVRVEMRRLRGKLDEHYANDGAGRQAVIRLRRGSYVPWFIPAEQAGPARGTDSPANPGGLGVVPSGRRRGLAAAVAALVVVGAGAAWFLWSLSGAQSRPRVAVLPFTTERQAPALAEAAATLTGDVTSALVRLNQFEIVPRRSAAAFAGGPDVRAHASESLDADWLVEAALRPNGSHVVAEVRLVDATRDRKVWVESFVGESSGTERLARAIAERVGAQIDRSER